MKTLVTFIPILEKYDYLLIGVFFEEQLWLRLWYRLCKRFTMTLLGLLEERFESIKRNTKGGMTREKEPHLLLSEKEFLCKWRSYDTRRQREAKTIYDGIHEMLSTLSTRLISPGSVSSWKTRELKKFWRKLKLLTMFVFIVGPLKIILI